MSSRMNLNVYHNPAHERSKYPRVRDVPDDGRRRAKEHHENVGEREIHNKNVGDALHALGRRHGDKDEAVANDTREKDDDNERDENHFVRVHRHPAL